MEKLAYKISGWFLEKKHIDETQLEDVRFALEVIMSNLASFFSILCIGILFNQFGKTAFFVLAFIGFRTIKDRYHAETFAKCYLLTVGSFLVCLSVSYIIQTKSQIIFSIYIVLLNILLYAIFFEMSLYNPKDKRDKLFKYTYLLYNFLCLVINLLIPSSFSTFISVLGTIILLTVINVPKRES